MTSRASLKLDMLPPVSGDDLGEELDDDCCAAAMLSAAEEEDPLLLGDLIVLSVSLGEVLPDMLDCCKLLLDRERMVLVVGSFREMPFVDLAMTRRSKQSTAVPGYTI